MKTLTIFLMLSVFLNADFVKHSNIDYNLDPQKEPLNTLDIYIPKTKKVKDLPIMVYVHGGGWCVGDKARVHHKAKLFTKEQYIFVSINYRLSPYPLELTNKKRIQFPDHPYDVGEAVAWIYKNINRYGGDRNRVFLLGHSAGAHLVTLVATDPQYLANFDAPFSIIRGTCALDGAVYDIPEYLAISGKEMHFNAFGTEEENKKNNHWKLASPFFHASYNDAPMLLVTQKNKTRRVDQNNKLAKALSSAKVYLVNKSHRQINIDLGNSQDKSMLTMIVTTFFERLK
ncbi:alpha/beta hydrolase [Candidatus Uabimicrobium sp. HlEnr_7]|uniref:alpha/beta hydrolase n=1 Tax=Candidatus Uabimicrobium helgolandensis TaxID=3095367 RepID=UPI0035565737